MLVGRLHGRWWLVLLGVSTFRGQDRMIAFRK